MKSTILVKLTGTLFIVILVCLTIVGFTLSFMIKNYLFDQKERELTIKGRDTAEIVKPFLLYEEDPHAVVNLINRADLSLGTEVWVVDKTGSVIAASANHWYCEGNTLRESEIRDMRSGLTTVTRGQSEHFTKEVIRVTVPVIERDKVLGAVILYSPILGVDNALENIIEMIVISGLLSLVIAFLIGLYLSNRLSKPIIELTSASAAIANGEKNVEVPVITDIEEINQFGRTFNYMAEKIEANETKMKDFVGNVSHELRSPLTSIKGFVQALIENKGKSDRDRQKFLETVFRETNRLDNLVKDLLTLARADSYKQEPEEVDVVRVLDEVIIQLNSVAREKEIHITVRNNDYIPPVKIFPDELRQILINLLDNAIKYSFPQDIIEIFFEIQDETVQISIKDYGSGIPEEDLDNIWDRFYRVDKSRTRETGGTGLGLAIVKQLVEKNKGTVAVESTLGKGSVFSVTLPVYVEEASAS